MSEPQPVAPPTNGDDRGWAADVETPDRWRTPMVVGVGLAMALLFTCHVDRANGPALYPWGWRRVAAGPTAAIAILAVMQAAIAIGATRPRLPLWVALSALTVGSFALRLGVSCALSEGPGLEYARVVVREPTIGSFFTFAQGLRAGDWTMRDFPELMRVPGVPLHVVNKPPAPTMFWYAVLGLGVEPDRAADVGVVIVAALSAAAVPLMAACVLGMGGGTVPARHAASLLSMSPGAIAFFPMFDPAYTTVALALMTLWFTSLRRRSFALAAIAGACVAASLFVAFHLLPIGLFLLTVGACVASGDRRTRLRRIVSNGAVAGVSCAAGVVALKLAIGYDALETLRSALDGQRALIERFGSTQRPYPATIAWDLYDAVLGVGFVPAVLAMWLLARPRGRRTAAAIGWCGIVTLIAVAVAGLLPGEGARVWNFLFPLLAIPAAAELARATRRDGVAAYATLAVVLVAMLVDLRFMGISSVVMR